MDAHRLKFGRDVTIAAAATATRSGRNLLLLPLLTRFLTPDDFGLYSQIAVTVALLIPWVSLQLSGAVVHFLAGINARGQIREGFYSILLFVGLCGSLCGSLTKRRLTTRSLCGPDQTTLRLTGPPGSLLRRHKQF